MSRVHEVKPEAETSAVLPRAHFVDAYQATMLGQPLTAKAAAKLMFDRSPGWLNALMGIRDAAVRPFGVKTSKQDADPSRAKIGFFPIHSVGPERAVLGFDDKHLDFRVVVDTVWTGAGGAVTVTTLVRLNNTFGRLYLATIKPFHRLVVRSMLERLASVSR